jgi:hypothetical protein
MDIYINTTIDKIEQILKEKSFTIKRKSNHFSAMQYVKDGRYHFMYNAINNEIFCDFHFDNKIHGIGMGADYGKKPEEYFKQNLQPILENLKLKYTTKRVNWFTRRNKAIITGMRI